MTLFYFGADKSWSDLVKDGFYRRNTWLLKSFIESGYFNNLYVVHFTPVKYFIKKIISKQNRYDIYYTNFFPSYLLRYKIILKINNFLIKLSFIIQNVKNINSKSNIIWSYWPKGFFDAVNIKIKGRYFFDTDHNIIDDVNIDNYRRQKIAKLLYTTGKKCEKVVSSSRSMLRWYNKYGFNNTVRVRNGICLKRFTNIPNISISISRPIIGYVGTISKWIDYDIFESLIKNNPNYSFVIYGKNYKTSLSDQLKKYKNVFFMGIAQPDKVPMIIKQFDIALNLYKRLESLDVDSMKIYEYLAAGVPVVTTRFHDFLDVDFNNLLYIGNSTQELERHIKHILKNKENYEYMCFLKKNTWEKRVNEIIQMINES